MNNIKNKLKNRNVFSTITVSALIPCLFATLIWAVTILPAGKEVARKYDEASVQLITENASNQWHIFTNTIRSSEYFLQHTSWVRPLYVDLINGKESSNLDKQNAVSELSLMANHSFGMELFSFNFYERENYLYTSKGVITDIAEGNKSQYDSLKKHFVPSRNQKGTYSVLTFGENRYLVYSAPFRDIEGGRPKGDLNLFFDLKNIERVLLHAVDGQVAEFIYKDPYGVTVWKFDTKLFSESAQEVSVRDQDSGYQLCLKIPDSVYYKTRKKTEGVMIAVLAVTLFLSIALSVLFAKAAYQPLKQVVGKYFGNTVSRENEFQTIDKALEQIHPLAKQRVLGTVLDGTIALAPSCDKQLSYLGIEFLHENFNVICMEVSFSQDTENDESFMSALMEEAVKSIRTSEKVSVFLYYKEANFYQVILNYASGDDEWNRMYHLIENYKGLLIQYFIHGSLFVGVGLPVNRIEDVHRAANQAETAMRVARTNNIHTPVYYGNLVMKKAYEYDYPLSEVMLMTKAIMSNDIDKARALLKEILERRKDDKTVNPDTLYLLYMDLGLTVTRGARSINVSMQQVEFKKKIRNIEDIEEAIGLLLDEIEQQIGGRKQFNTSPGHQQIVDYIEEHLFDSQLSVAQVAEANGKSEAYVSNFVKEHYGMNWNVYVNKMRIMKAVQLMTENGLDSNTVFPMVGYTNLSTFRRNYIKHTSRTPGQGGIVGE